MINEKLVHDLAEAICPEDDFDELHPDDKAPYLDEAKSALQFLTDLGLLDARRQSRDEIFIRHISGHLEPGQEVICKVCGRTALEIIKEGWGSTPTNRAAQCLQEAKTAAPGELRVFNRGSDGYACTECGLTEHEHIHFCPPLEQQAAPPAPPKCLICHEPMELMPSQKPNQPGFFRCPNWHDWDIDEDTGQPIDDRPTPHKEPQNVFGRPLGQGPEFLEKAFAPKVQEGWWWPLNANRAHYMVGNRSLCRRWGGDPMKESLGSGSGWPLCVKCMKRLARRTRETKELAEAKEFANFAEKEADQIEAGTKELARKEGL